jgi:hypothetical protein
MSDQVIRTTGFVERFKHDGGWRIERHWTDGSISVVQFYGPRAEQESQEYATWLNRQAIR